MVKRDEYVCQGIAFGLKILSCAASEGHIGAFLKAATRSVCLSLSWIKLAKVCRCRLIFSKWNLGNSKFSLFFFFFFLSCKNNLLWWATSLQPSLVSATFWIRLVIPGEGSLGLEPESIVKDWYKFISDVCRKYCYAGKVVMSFNAVCGSTFDSFLRICNICDCFICLLKV